MGQQEIDKKKQLYEDTLVAVHTFSFVKNQKSNSNINFVFKTFLGKANFYFKNGKTS